MDKDDNDLRLEIHLFFESRTAGPTELVVQERLRLCREHRPLDDVHPRQRGFLRRGTSAWQFSTLIHFNHQPASEYFGFQLGDGANNHNCDEAVLRLVQLGRFHRRHGRHGLRG